MRTEPLGLRAPGRAASLGKMKTDSAVELRVAFGRCIKDIARQTRVPGGGFDEIEMPGTLLPKQLPHLRQLLSDCRAEQRTHVDARVEVSLPARSPSGGGVVPVLSIVEGKLHEAGDGDRAALTDDRDDAIVKR